MSALVLSLLLSTAPQAGVGLGLFASDPRWDYGPMLDEIAKTGTKDVLIAVVWTQRTVRSVDIHRQPGLTPDDDTVVRALEQARARGLRPLLLPIVRTEHQAIGEWRGTIAPAAGVDAWFSAYRSFLLLMADLARRGGAEKLSVGSELLSLEKHEPHWRALIAEVRTRFPGKLLYSANWDHFEAVPFWDAVDEIGVTAYFELAHTDALPEDRALDRAWAGPRAALVAFAKQAKKPLVITEIGYPSQRGAARFPWDETSRKPVDLAAQAALYRAFCRAFVDAPGVSTAYFWNWFGKGGPDDDSYTPRGKPAAREISRCFR